MVTNKTKVSILVVLLVFSLLLCGFFSQNPLSQEEPPEEKELTDLNIPKDSRTLEVGESSLFIAIAEYSDGSTEEVTRKADWRVRHLSIAKVRDGEVQARREGSTTITATYREKRATASVTVSAPELNIEVVPPEPAEENPVTLVLSGEWKNSCAPQNPEANIVEGQTSGGEIIVDLSTPEGPCLQAVTSWEEKVNLGTLSAGTYKVTVNLDEEILGRDSFEVSKTVEDCELKMFAHEGGTTEPQPGTHSFAYGETLAVEAIAAEGWEFTGWEREGSASACDTQENPCEFEITNDAHLAAHFAEKDNGYEPPGAREVNVEVLPPDAQEGDPATIHVHGTWENSCVPKHSDHTLFGGYILRIETVNRSEACLTAVTDFSLLVDIDELPPVLRVEVYYESTPQDYYALIASEHFSFPD